MMTSEDCFMFFSGGILGLLIGILIGFRLGIARTIFHLRNAQNMLKTIAQEEGDPR